MTRENRHCDPDQIEQLLDGRLTADEQSLLEQHIGACTTCRGRMEMTAAEQKYWNEAAVHLRDDAFDEESKSGEALNVAEADESSSDERVNPLRISDYFDPTDDPRMLGRFGGYEIVGIVGFGGMGVVLKGYEAALDRYVAIKVLAPHLATSGAARSRFAREARAAAAVLHENVVAIHRVSQSNGLPFLVMPYLAGDSLQKRLDVRGPLELNEVLRIGMQIAAGLAAAHAQGLVHRDIKPANILLDSDVERVTITDFGLARAIDDASLTRSGVIAGTPQYMSPEQARGEPLDGRSDLFSLGTVLYTLCAGHPPFRAETAFGVLQRISEPHSTPLRQIAPQTPEWLCEIIAKLHAKKPADRFQTAGDVAELLGRWLAHSQQPTIIPAPPRTVDAKKVARRRRRLMAVGAIAVAAGALVAASIHFWPREVKPQPVGSAQTSAPRTLERSDARSVHSSLQPLVDEQTLYDEYKTVQKGISKVESEWSQTSTPTGQDAWNADVPALNRRLDELRQQIDRNMP